MDLVKHPSPAQPSSAVKQLLAKQGSDRIWQFQATFSRAEHRGLIDTWWTSHVYNLSPCENQPKGVKYNPLQVPAPSQQSQLSCSVVHGQWKKWKIPFTQPPHNLLLKTCYGVVGSADFEPYFPTFTKVQHQFKTPFPSPNASMAELKYKKQVFLIKELQPCTPFRALIQPISPTPRPGHFSVLPSTLRSLNCFHEQILSVCSHFLHPSHYEDN